MNYIMKILKQNNKSIFRKSLALIFCLAMFISCDKGFLELNTSPHVMTEPNINAIFANSVYTVAGRGDNGTQYPRDKVSGAIVQWWSTLNHRQWVGVAYIIERTDYTGGFFQQVYNSELRDCQELLYMTKDDPAMSNLNNILRIWRVYILHRVTDLYGDVPYSEAGMGYQKEIYKPKFDKQQDIYHDMLKELDEASAALVVDASKASFGKSDYVYEGDVEKWRKFGYSLMLRLAMRTTKVEQATAETYVKKAIAGGVFTSNADIAYMEHNEANSNGYNQHTNRFDGVEVVPRNANGTGYGKVAATFVNMLRDNYDPRSPFFITLWQGNRSGVSLADRELYSKIEDQVGLPTGYDDALIKTVPGFEDFVAPTSYTRISEVNLNTIGHRAAPNIFMQYFEVEYLLAEAALRGWESGTPKEHYEKGVRASMSNQYLYPGNYVITEADIANYLNGTGGNGTQGMPWDAAAGDFERGMELIHTQFWISNYLNGLEAFANWRRTEYPKLTAPNLLPGSMTGGIMPRRVPYNDTEKTRNEANYKEALSQQGWASDGWTQRMWWDKQ